MTENETDGQDIFIPSSSFFSFPRIMSIVSAILLAHGAIQFLINPEWWVYVPVYGLSSILVLFPCPSSSVWRLFTSIAIVCGGLYMLFLAWTFHFVEQSFEGMDFPVGRQLMPIALGVLLTTSVRIKSDNVTRLHNAIRFTLLHFFFIMSTFCAVASIKYYL